MSFVSSPEMPAFVSSKVTQASRYFLDLEPKRGDEISVVCGGRERCAEDYVVRRKDFSFLCLEFVAEGHGQLQLNQRQFPLRPGVVFFYGPNIPHRITNDSQSRMLKYYVDFVGLRAEQMIAESPLSKGKPVQVSALAEIQEIYEQLQRNGFGETPYSREICAALIPLLILKIKEKTVQRGGAEPQTLASYQRARRYLEEHFQELHTLEEIAAAIHMTPSYLCRLFKKYGHLTPYQYLLRLKMNLAADRLMNSQQMVKEIAAELHFSDPFTFTRAFKSVYGLAPEHFAKLGKRLG